MASGDMKGFYKQTKKTKTSGGISKPAPASSSSKKASAKNRGGRGGGSATLGSGDPPQAPAMIAHGSYDLDERKLRQFDMDMRYGPCLGITRLERWQRADSMGLNPPRELKQMLLNHAKLECLWEGRV